MLPLLEIVAHAWRYERALTFHLSALVLYPPAHCRALAVIYYAPDDLPVIDTLNFFARLPRPSSPPAVEFDFRPLAPELLCRRAIGRNMAARETRADFVLFSDVDYLYGPGALDSAAEKLAEANQNGPKCCYSIYLQSSIDHAAGDAELARVDRPQVIAVDPSQYEPQRLVTAIGGSQWIPGSLAREKGYLSDGHRYLRPVDTWQRTFCDAAARRNWLAPIVGLEVPNVYRLRHSLRGRFDRDCRN
jgi:hypothetical protein